MITLSPSVASATSDLLALVQLLNTKGLDKTLGELKDLSKEVTEAQTDLEVREQAVKKQQEQLFSDIVAFKDSVEKQQEEDSVQMMKLQIFKEQTNKAETDVKIRQFEVSEKEKAIAEKQTTQEAGFVSRENAIFAREKAVSEREASVAILQLELTTKLAALKSAIG